MGRIRWRCTTHHGKYCYKQYDTIPASEHADLDPTALSDWAQAIVNKAHFVDLNTPPRGPKWDAILNPHRRKSSSTDTPQPNYSQPAIHVHIPSHSPRRSPRFNHGYSTPASPRTPTQRGRRHLEPLTSSPVLLEHESWAEFDGDGLKAFITYCEHKFKVTGTDFQEAYLRLRENDVHPDVLRGKQAAWYEKHGIKSGTADRLYRSFNKWYAKMQQEA